MNETTSKVLRTLIISAASMFSTIVTVNIVDNCVRRQQYADTLSVAIQKGADPMSVGCAWGFYQSGEAVVCALNQVNKGK